MELLVVEEDFYHLAKKYFIRAQREGIVRCEVFFDPQAHTARGVQVQDVMSGFTRACEYAEIELGLECCLILCFLRHLDEDEAFDILDQCIPHRNSYWVGIGLDSNEIGNPPEKFTRVFAECKRLGFQLVAHAGEEGSHVNITTALDDLGVVRIDHGVACVHNDQLMERLAKEKIPLTVCPLSNLRLQVIDDLSKHVMLHLLEKQVVATINSDDPAYFGGYVVDNFTNLFRSCPQLGPKHAYQLSRNSIHASFANDSSKLKWLNELDQLFSRFFPNQRDYL
jgi:adenosine deaminase